MRSHPVLDFAMGVLPAHGEMLTRSLIGWNAAVWIYLALMAWIMLRTSPAQVRQTSDVAVMTQTVSSFLFNAAILGFSINIAASMMGE